MNVGSLHTTVTETQSVKIQLAVTVVPAIQDTKETVFRVLVGILFHYHFCAFLLPLSVTCMPLQLNKNLHFNGR